MLPTRIIDSARFWHAWARTRAHKKNLPYFSDCRRASQRRPTANRIRFSNSCIPSRTAIRLSRSRRSIGSAPSLGASLSLWRYDTRTLADGQNLVRFQVREPFDLLACGPFHFNKIHLFGLTETEVKAEVSLRHHA